MHTCLLCFAVCRFWGMGEWVIHCVCWGVLSFFIARRRHCFGEGGVKQVNRFV